VLVNVAVCRPGCVSVILSEYLPALIAFLALMTSFAFFLDSVALPVASVLLPFLMSKRSDVFLAASAPLPVHETVILLPLPLVLQLSLIASFGGFAVGVTGLGVAVAVGATVGTAVGVGRGPGSGWKTGVIALRVAGGPAAAVPSAFRYTFGVLP